MAFDVAVTGMGIVSAIGTGKEAFERALFTGSHGFVDSPVGRGFYAPVSDFDWPGSATGSVRKIGRRAPRTVQLSLTAALEAFEEADATAIDSERVGLVVAGTNINQSLAHATALSEAKVSPRYGLQFLDSDHVGCISAACGVRGESTVIGAGSASGNAGVIHGARLVDSGVVDACLVVGAPSSLSVLELEALSDLGALCIEDRPAAEACRPFDAQNAGFVPGEAAAALFLERPGEASARGVDVLARVAGGAMVADANHLTDPSVDGEVRAMQAALRAATLEPTDVDLYSAHGTAARLGDGVEVAAVQRVFGAETPIVVATKGLTGHALNAAGVVEAVAVVMQLRAGRVHPNRNLVQPIADLPFAGAASEARAMEVALSLSLAFGGLSTALVIRR